MTKTHKKNIWTALVVTIVLVGLIGLYYAWGFFGSNVGGDDPEAVLYIRPEANYQEVQDSLHSKNVLKNQRAFAVLAELKSLDSSFKPGRYELRKGMSNNALVNKLKAGNEDPVQLTINQISSRSRLAAKLGNQLAADSVEFLALLNDEAYLRQKGFDRATGWMVFLPNTYEFYWGTTPEATYERMLREYHQFWTESRLNKAQQKGLSHKEVVILASIVESETVQAEEMPKVAGLYLNRLDRNMRLQSDPTVIYGIRQQYPDSTIKRVLFSHLHYESPYNTYRNKGLPPGPVRIPSLKAIHAVLNAENHEYIFMAADPERPGYHSFAKNLNEHNRNRAEYIRWIRRQR